MAFCWRYLVRYTLNVDWFIFYKHPQIEYMYASSISCHLINLISPTWLVFIDILPLGSLINRIIIPYPPSVCCDLIEAFQPLHELEVVLVLAFDKLREEG